MSEQPQPPTFEFDLGDRGSVVKLTSADELRSWGKEERQQWEWLWQKGTEQAGQLRSDHNQWRSITEQVSNEWRNAQNNPKVLEQVFITLDKRFDEFYCQKRIVHSSSADAAFLNKLRAAKGDAVAAGAYLAITGAKMQTGEAFNAGFFEGMFEGFLYEREIEWTASAHREIFEKLKNEYTENISKQETRFTELDAKNTALNASFSEKLSMQNGALEKLHADQVEEFRKLREDHEKKLESIETTYNQKLALQKPVEYWQAKQTYHGRRSGWFGMSALITGLLLAGGMGWLIYWVFKGLGANENPKHWHIGLVLVGSFFTIWIVRILVRMFFSHVHLATDAAERRTMILTYLAMSREGSEFAPDDKRLILQHLFRTASDGLVKDDAAPPTPMEWLTRR